MAISREAIYAALFARLKAQVGLCKTFSRKWLHAQEGGNEQQPALLCLEGNELPRDEPPRPPVWTLEATVVVYARTNDVATPGTVLSNILDQIEAALEFQAADGVNFFTEVHTMFGIRGVQRAWIAGQVQKEDGAETGGQGWITLPIHILV